MGKYNFETHYGKCTLTDASTGIVIEWEKGKFNEAQQTRIENQDTLLERYTATELAMVLARTCKDMADYALENYKEFV